MGLKRLICLYFMFLSLGLCGDSSRYELELGNGSVLRGVVVYETYDKVFFDLGFTVLDIPRSFIADSHLLQDMIEETEMRSLYVTKKNLPKRSVEDLVQEKSAAVVTVKTPIGLGSGFFINEDGYLITNNHVISGELDVSVTCFSPDDSIGGTTRTKEYKDVRIVATSPFWDLALLKIEGEDETIFPILPLGKTDDLRQGDPVFAIGNPLGLERTVSRGILSNIKRLIGGRLFLQTTAEISPGNSGGPLLNLRGEVVGVNNMKVVSQGAEGLAFSIPVTALKNFLENRDAYAFDPRNANSGFRYLSPPKLTQKNEEDNQ